MLASYPTPEDVIAAAEDSNRIVNENAGKISNLEHLSHRLSDQKSKIERRPETLRRINVTRKYIVVYDFEILKTTNPDVFLVFGVIFSG